MAMKELKRQKTFHQDWSCLPSLLLDSTLENLPSIHDYIRFGFVCKHWRNVALDQKLQRTKSLYDEQAPLLLLQTNSNQRSDIDLYNVSGGKVVHSFDLPYRLRDDEHLRLCGSSQSWLAYIDAGFVVTLFNPFSRDTIRLPRLVMEAVKKTKNINKVVLSANPSLFPNEYEALAIFETHDDDKVDVANGLAHFKSGDNAWTYCDKESTSDLDIIDATYYKGRFVALNYGNNFYSNFQTGIDLGKVHPSIECISHPHIRVYHTTSYLVKSASEDLLLVNILLNLCSSILTDKKRSRIFKLGSSAVDGSLKWETMESLGSDALFLDDMHAVCSSASDLACVPNRLNYLMQVVTTLGSRESEKVREMPKKALPVTWIMPSLPTLRFSSV